MRPGSKCALSGKAARGNLAVLATRRIQLANLESLFAALGIPNKGLYLDRRGSKKSTMKLGLKLNARGAFKTLG